MIRIPADPSASRRGLFLVAASLLLATPAAGRAQELVLPRVSPQSAQLTSILAYLVPAGLGTALLIPEDASNGAVVAGGLLFWAGSIVGPATGYWRAGAAARGWQGVAIRGGLTAVTFAVVAPADDFGDFSGFLVAATIGVLGVTAHAIFDVVRVKPIIAARQRTVVVTFGPAPGWVRGPAAGLRIGW